ncbi:MAG: phytanoyl-CoA dioxygenase family protein [Alphaproteobacteria bacterium]|nr:phytanoyl-CoA dioxygenase family protein [Alphaproteobacteria bacterium]
MTSLKTAFERDGYAYPFRVLDPDEASEAASGYDRFQQRARKIFGEQQRFKAHLLVGWMDRIVHHPKLLDVVEDILGPDILCWSSDFFVKKAHDPGFVSFHQDTTYAGLEPFDGILNCWLALTPSRKENGCLRVLPGTHKLGQLDHETTSSEANMLFFGQTAQIDVDERDVVDMELEPGEMSLHHMAVVHGSQPNRSDTPRLGVVLRYIRPDVRQIKARDSATLVHGTDRHGHFDLEPRPEADWSDAAIVAFKDAINRPSALG